MRWCWTLFVVFCAGCSFETLGSGDTRPSPGVGEGETEAATGTSESGDSSSGAGVGSTTTGSTVTSTPGTTAPMPTTQDSETADATDSQPPTSSSSSGDGSGDTTSDVVDCSEPRTFVLSASEAELTDPMVVTEYQGVGVASSSTTGIGSISFKFTVDCPSTYRVYGYVRDDWPGVHNCCDPDSFFFQDPMGEQGTWYYGCDTTKSASGMSWVRLEDGADVTDCPDTVPVEYVLSPNEYSITLINRENQHFGATNNGAIAGIATLVVTSDPEYSP